MPRISVIVPVYNVERYLPACIDSILNQSFYDLEVILIDDGSPDRCGMICDEYSHKDKRIKVIHQDNHGVSFARNEGLKIATGDYYGFVDPDDFISPDMYCTMIKAAEDEDAGIAICGFAYCTENGRETRRDTITPGILSQRELIMSIYGMPNPYHGSMCNKIFSRKILQGLGFDEEVAVGEDWLLLYECYEQTNKAVVLGDCFYSIRMRHDSATRKHTAGLYIKKLETYDRLFNYSKGKDKEIRKQATNKILDTYLANKEAIIRNDYDRKCIRSINNRLIRVSLKSLIKGELPIKQTIYYLKRGLEF